MLKKIKAFLFCPLQKIDEPDRYRQAELLALLLFLLIVIQGGSLFFQNKSVGLLPSYYKSGIWIVILSYLISRTKLYPAGALLWAINNSAIIFLDLITQDQLTLIRSELPFLTFSMLLPALFVGYSLVLLIGIVNLFLILLLYQFNSIGITSIQDIQNGILFNVASTIFLTAILFYKQYLEQLRNTAFLKQAEDLKVSRERLSQAQRIAKLGNWDWNIKTGELHWSDEIYRIFGLKMEEFPANYETFINMVHPDDREIVIEALNTAIMEKLPYSVEHRIVLRDNSQKILHERGEVFYDSAGKAVRMIGAVLDITKQKNDEKIIMERQREIEKLNKNLEKSVLEELMRGRQKDAMLVQQSRLAAMGEMIGHIAHQWRQPLNALNLLIANLKYSYEDNEINDDYMCKFFEKSRNYIQKMSSTIDDFRDYFRPDKNKEIFLFSDVIEKTFSLVEATFQNLGITLSAELDKDLTCIGYPNEFSQVLLNILSNAKDAIIENQIKDGKIEVSATKNERDAVILIEDNGGGINEANLPKIFDPYFSTKDEGKGTGIGLYMSKNIIEDHMMGKIFATNIEGGVRFTITIPIERE